MGKLIYFALTISGTGFRSRHHRWKPGRGILEVNYGLEWQHSRGLVGTRIAGTPAPIHICPPYTASQTPPPYIPYKGVYPGCCYCSYCRVWASFLVHQSPLSFFPVGPSSFHSYCFITQKEPARNWEA